MNKLWLLLVLSLALLRSYGQTPPSSAMTAIGPNGVSAYLTGDANGNLQTTSAGVRALIPYQGYAPPVALMLLGPTGYVNARADANGNLQTTGSGGGGGSAGVQAEFVFTAGGSQSQNFSTNLNSMYPMWSCITLSGTQCNAASITVIDANNVTFTSAGNTDTVVNFQPGGVRPPDFSLSVSPTSQNYTISGSGTQTVPYTVTQAAINGYTGTTTPSCTSLAAGMSCGFSPTTMTGGTTSTLTLSFPAAQAAGTTNFNISATDGTLTHTTPAVITVATPLPELDGWFMNEGVGTTFFDTNTVNANDQTFLSSIGSWGTVSGFPGNVFTFNGTGGSTGSNNTLTNFDGTKPFSVSTWINLSSITTEAELMSSYGASPPYTGWAITANQSGSTYFVTFYIINAYGSNAIVTNSPLSSITLNAKENVVCTYDGSKTAAGVKIYVNGVLQTPTVQQDSLTGSAANSNNLMLGDSLAGFPIVGIEADVRIFSIALTQGQVTALFNAGAQ